MTVIGVSGSYGGLNVGDEAILACIIAELRRTVADAAIVVLSRDAEHTRTHHDVDHVIPARRVSRQNLGPMLAELDLLTLGGGGLLYDGEAPAYLRDVRLAHEIGLPTMTYAIGTGPLQSPDDRRIVRETLDSMNALTVREASAQRQLEELGVSNPIVPTADPALLMTPEPFTDQMLVAEGIDPDTRLVGMSVREPGGAAPTLDTSDYHDLVGNAADYIAHRFDADVVFVPMESQDLRHAHQVIAHMTAASRAHVLRRIYSPAQVLGLMSHLEFAVGMRLHFVIFAALAAVPVLPLPYASKVEGFLERLGLPPRALVHQDRPGPLLAYIDHLWDTRGEIRRTLPATVGTLRCEAARTVDVVSQLLGIPPSSIGGGSPRTEKSDATVTGQV
jgi:polysaccharide pyruvyl transferase CsaB